MSINDPNAPEVDVLAIEKSLAPCPFFNRPLKTVPYLCDSAHKDGFFVACDCGATGPLASTEEEAAALWNNRA